MSYQIMFHPGAAKFLEKLEEQLKNRIKDAARQLEQDPFQSRSGADIKKLKGTKGRHDLFRLRVGDYRLIYAVENETVWITEIFSRGRGYKT